MTSLFEIEFTSSDLEITSITIEGERTTIRVGRALCSITPAEVRAELSFKETENPQSQFPAPAETGAPIADVESITTTMGCDDADHAGDVSNGVKRLAPEPAPEMAEARGSSSAIDVTREDNFEIPAFLRRPQPQRERREAA